MRPELMRGILSIVSDPHAADLAAGMLVASRKIGMNTVRAKCPNCWETDECTVVDTKEWMMAGKQPSQTGTSGGAPQKGGYNLKCPTCNTVFWHEDRSGTRGM